MRMHDACQAADGQSSGAGGEPVDHGEPGEQRKQTDSWGNRCDGESAIPGDDAGAETPLLVIFVRSPVDK